MTRRAAIAWGLGLGVLIFTGCTDVQGSIAKIRAKQWKAELGWPRLELEMAGGYHGGRWTLLLDRDGHYVHESSDEDGGGNRIDRACGGTLEASRVRQWIDRVATLPLSPYEFQTYREMAREHPATKDAIVGEAFLFVYWPSEGVSRMPADLATYEGVRDEARGWFREHAEQRATLGEQCE